MYRGDTEVRIEDTWMRISVDCKPYFSNEPQIVTLFVDWKPHYLLHESKFNVGWEYGSKNEVVMQTLFAYHQCQLIDNKFRHGQYCGHSGGVSMLTEYDKRPLAADQLIGVLKDVAMSSSFQNGIGLPIWKMFQLRVDYSLIEQAMVATGKNPNAKHMVYEFKVVDLPNPRKSLNHQSKDNHAVLLSIESKIERLITMLEKRNYDQ